MSLDPAFAHAIAPNAQPMTGGEQFAALTKAAAVLAADSATLATLTGYVAAALGGSVPQPRLNQLAATLCASVLGGVLPRQL